MASKDTRVARQLRDVGLRITAPRVAVLEVLGAHPHASAETVAAQVRSRLGRVSTQAVYDVLAACTEVGLVRRIKPGGSAALFETRTGDNHHHLVCRFCRRTTDVECALTGSPCLVPDDDAGYELDEAEIVFWGRCPRCQNEDVQSEDGPGSGSPGRSCSERSSTRATSTRTSATGSWAPSATRAEACTRLPS